MWFGKHKISHVSSRKSGFRIQSLSGLYSELCLPFSIRSEVLGRWLDSGGSMQKVISIPKLNGSGSGGCGSNVSFLIENDRLCRFCRIYLKA